MISREMKSKLITVPSYRSKPPLQQSAHAQSDVRLSDIVRNTSENSPYKNSVAFSPWHEHKLESDWLRSLASRRGRDQFMWRKWVLIRVRYFQTIGTIRSVTIQARFYGFLSWWIGTKITQQRKRITFRYTCKRSIQWRTYRMFSFLFCILSRPLSLISLDYIFKSKNSWQTANSRRWRSNCLYTPDNV